MEDREMLELAAKAADIELLWRWSDADCKSVPTTRHKNWYAGGIHQDQLWNPLADDGDALRLAVKLGLDIMTRRAHGGAYTGTPEHGASTSAEDEPYAATRRAIVRAAAEIGKAAP